MRKYVFITLATSGLGGGQLYTATKTAWLEKQGYEVFTLSCIGINNHEHNQIANKAVFKELNVFPQSISPTKLRKVISEMKEILSPVEDDAFFIESQTIHLSMWGEILAEALQGKHICLSISESNKITADMLPFIEYKCLRRELASINPDFFQGVYGKSKIVEKSSIAHLIAYMGNQAHDYVCEQIESVKLSEINICVFGRLDKSYVQLSADEIVRFIRMHSGQTFTIVYVGDTTNEKNRKNLFNKYKKEKNVKLFLAGGLSPVPIRMFSMFDVIIGGAGCATLSYKNGAKTIAMDVTQGCKPLGILGYDVTKSFAASAIECSLSELLEKVIIGGYGSEWQPYSGPIATADDFYGKHMEFLENTEKENAYYDCLSIKLSLKEKIVDLLSKICGNRGKAYFVMNKVKSFSIKLKTSKK